MHGPRDVAGRQARHPACKATFDEIIAFAERAAPGRVQKDMQFVAAVDRVDAGRFAAHDRDRGCTAGEMEHEIFTFGLSEPFLARPSDTTNYELLAEHAVFVAAVRAGTTCVRLVVVDIDDGAAAAVAQAAAGGLAGA